MLWIILGVMTKLNKPANLYQQSDKEMYNTDGLIQAAIQQERMLNDVGHSHQAALNLTNEMAQCLTYCWKVLRGKEGSITYGDYQVNVGSLGGRTMVSIIKGAEYISFVGGSSDVTVGCQGLSVETFDSLHEFRLMARKFAQVCTEEMVVKESMSIG